MRILIDYRPALRQRTGVGHYVHELAAALLPQLEPADALVLFSASWKDRLPSSAVPGARIVDWRIPVRALNLGWHRLGWPPVERFAGPVNIAHSTHPLLIPTRRAASVVTIYDLDFLDHPERTRAEIRRDYAPLVPDHARRANLVVVISEHTADQVRTRLGVPADRIVVCRPGAPAWNQRLAPDRPGPILFVGTIEPRKNLPTLFAAYERVVQRRPDAPPLVLAGRIVEHSADILETLKSRPALASRVHHLGYVSDDDRYRLYVDASMLVLPSLEEGFGMTAVEAMQAGLPLVASNAGALPEVVGDAGFLVDPLDDAAMASAIERVLDNAPLRLAMAEAGRRRAGAFTWSGSAAVLLEAYRDAFERWKAESAR